jgi:hypothetical protein
MDWEKRGKSFFYGIHRACKAQPHEHITHAVMDWIEEGAPSSQERK